MNYKIEKQLVQNAINNCNANDDPVTVNGQDFADDLSHALSVINTLLVQVEKLEIYIESTKPMSSALRVSLGPI